MGQLFRANVISPECPLVQPVAFCQSNRLWLGLGFGGTVQNCPFVRCSTKQISLLFKVYNKKCVSRNRNRRWSQNFRTYNRQTKPSSQTPGVWWQTPVIVQQNTAKTQIWVRFLQKIYFCQFSNHSAQIQKLVFWPAKIYHFNIIYFLHWFSFKDGQNLH